LTARFHDPRIVQVVHHEFFKFLKKEKFLKEEKFKGPLLTPYQLSAKNKRCQLLIMSLKKI
jgi:hypothetical protein